MERVDFKVQDKIKISVLIQDEIKPHSQTYLVEQIENALTEIYAGKEIKKEFKKFAIFLLR